MLKGTLEGIVLALLAGQPAYGYEITAWLREKGFADIAEGTVYALLIRIEQRGLVDVEKVPSEKGPPRKVYSLNAQGQAQLEEFWTTWTFLTERLEQLREGGRQTWHEWIEQKRRYRRYKKRIEPAPAELPHGGRRASSATSYHLGGIGDGESILTMLDDLADLFEQAAASGTPVREIVGDDPVEFVEAFLRNYKAGNWITREQDRLTHAVDQAEAEHPGAEPSTRAPRTHDEHHDAQSTHQATGIHVQGLEKSYDDAARPARRRLRSPQRQHLRPARLQRRRQDHVVKILSTLLKADAGTARVDGFDVAAQPANVRQSISLTGQFAAVDEILTGRENLVLVARLRHLEDRRPDRGRPAGPLPARRGCPAKGGDVLRAACADASTSR